MGSKRGGGRRTRGARPGRRSQASMRRYARTPIGVGIVVALVAIVGAAYIAAQREGVETDFEFQVYQGEDVLGGANLRLSDVVGLGTPVVLNFWAGDCPPCRFEMPDLQRSHERHQGDVLFLGMDVGVYTGLGSPRSAMALMDELDITYPVGSPPDRGAVEGYGVEAMPTTVFFDADGGVFERWEGAISESQLEGILSDLLR